MRLVRELVGSFVRNDDSFDRVEVHIARVVGEASTMHLEHCSFDSYQRLESFVKVRVLRLVLIKKLLEVFDVLESGYIHLEQLFQVQTFILLLRFILRTLLLLLRLSSKVATEATIVIFFSADEH